MSRQNDSQKSSKTQDKKLRNLAVTESRQSSWLLVCKKWKESINVFMLFTVREWMSTEVKLNVGNLSPFTYLYHSKKKPLVIQLSYDDNDYYWWHTYCNSANEMRSLSSDEDDVVLLSPTFCGAKITNTQKSTHNVTYMISHISVLF